MPLGAGVTPTHMAQVPCSFFVRQPKPKMDSQVRFRSTKVNKPVNKINKINQLNKSIEKAHRHLVLLYVLL